MEAIILFHKMAYQIIFLILRVLCFIKIIWHILQTLLNIFLGRTNKPKRNACNNCAVGNIFVDQTSCSNYAMTSNSNSRKNRCSITNKAIFPDFLASLKVPKIIRLTLVIILILTVLLKLLFILHKMFFWTLIYFPVLSTSMSLQLLFQNLL